MSTMVGEMDTGPATAGATPRAGTAVRAVLVLFSFGVTLDNVGVPGAGSVANLFIAALAVAALWQVVSTGRFRAPAPALLWLTAFVAWSALTLLWTRDLDRSTTRIFTYAALLGLVWLGWQCALSRGEVRWMMVGYAAGCTFAALLSWQSFLSGTFFTELEADWEAGLEDPRYAALGFDPNDMAVTLALSIPMVAHLALTHRGRLRYSSLVYLPLALSGVALSGSRGGALTAAMGLAFALLWLWRRTKTGVIVALALLVVAGLGIWWATPGTFARILTARQQLAGGTLGARTPIWRGGLQLLATHPLTGVGVGNFDGAVTRYLGYPMVAHNTPLSVAVELGLPGALLFLGAFVSNVLGARRSAVQDRELVVALAVTWFVGVLSLTYEYKKQTWLVLLLGAAMNQLSRTDPPGVVSEGSSGRELRGAE